MAGLAYALAAGLGLLATGAGVAGILGLAWTLRVHWLLPLGGLELALDPLGGFFLALIGMVTTAASIYAIGYAGGDPRGRFAYHAFVVSMCVVPQAANALTFLLAWELMALASYVLVLHERQDPAAEGAAWVYAVMTHAGLGCLLLGMLLLGAWTGSLRFADWHAATLAPEARNLAFGLLALGFASKAGVIPLHVWLPLAHPVAPSPVSALMSGAMIKLGVYGLLRIGLDWLGGGPAWWGVVILLAGVTSAVVGVLYALLERDLKRLLALSSIENVGIILIGLGDGMLFAAAELPALALLALVAALYHTINHAAFKGLLFLGAGAVAHGAGTRNLEEMGGLIKRMPWTAVAFLVGSLAIAGLPPLNGFVSEWLTFQALLQTPRLPRAELNLVFAVGIAGLALTAGLAMACFVRAFGIGFLALPRSVGAAHAHEVGATMRIGMAGLVLACVALGLGPSLVVPALTGVAAALIEVPAPSAPAEGLALNVSGDFATLSTPAVAAALVAGLGGLAGCLALLGAGRRRRIYETWGCGRSLQTARMEYTATAFANPFKRIFDFFYRPVKQLDIEFHPESRFFVQRIEYETPTRSVFDEWLYRPVVAAVRLGALRVRAIQSGSANLYLIYILAALLLMLVLA
jgi:hydrogenase-4 component B